MFLAKMMVEVGWRTRETNTEATIGGAKNLTTPIRASQYGGWLFIVGASPPKK
jgi:hypothetical protein